MGGSGSGRVHNYVAFGLGIASSLPVPELPASAEVGRDVVIRTGKVGLRSQKGTRAGTHFEFTDREAFFFWENVGAFLVRDGREIVVEPFPGVEQQIIRLPLLGVVMAMLLHQRGYLVLHSSAVALNGGAVLFLGGKGWGKSTIAATLHKQGCGFISDDVTALDFEATRRPIVLPAFPQLKLWPDAVASLGEDPEALPRLYSQIEKRHRRVANGFSHRPVALEQIFVLSSGPHVKFERLGPQEAMLELVRNLYVARFGRQVLQRGEATRFLQCAEVVRNTPVHRLRRPTSLPLAASVARLVEEHLASNLCPAVV